MYAIHQFDVNSVTLTASPLDDYQRLYFGTLLSLPREKQPNVDIRSVSYKSNVAELFRQGKGNTLECYEYLLPDVRSGADPSAIMTDLDGAAKERLKIRDGILSGVVQTNSQESMEDSLTKNQQFKLRKLGHSTQSRLINPNNCVLWTHDSGYVFLTGIWRLYQDVMRGLSSIPRVGEEENGGGSGRMCQEELEFITAQAFYDGHSVERKRRRHSSSGELGPTNARRSSSLTSYSDLHWNGLSGDLKGQLVNCYRNHLIRNGVSYAEASKVSLSDVMHRIRGGYIKIQGTWLPLEMAKLICQWFCFPIRYLLVPIFGLDFPRLCEDARNNGFRKGGFEMTHGLQNVFEPSKGRSMSWTPGMPQKDSSERLPPISSIMDSISDENYSYDRREPTVQTLSHLASFYNTHGHRYSYPGVRATQRHWRKPSWEDSRRSSVESRNSSSSNNYNMEYEFRYTPEITSPRMAQGAMVDRLSEKRKGLSDWKLPEQRSDRESRV